MAVLEMENRILHERQAIYRPKKARSPAEWRFRVLRWEWLDMEIHPREFPQGKVIKALRVHVPLEDKPYDVPYWDITSKREQAMLEPILAHVAGTGAYVYFRKEGEGVTSQYHMRVDPA